MKNLLRCGALLAIIALSSLAFGLNSNLATRPASQKKNTNAGAAGAGALYAKSCATCHGKDGEARTFKAKFNHARDFTDARWQESVTDERLFNSITNGKGKMPAFGKKFSEAEINSLVAHVHHFKK